MSKQTDLSVNTGGMLSTLLTVLFVGLKLTGYINWPWIWVLAPAWAPIALALTLILLGASIYAILKLFEKR